MIPKTSKRIPEAKKVLAFLLGQEVAKDTVTKVGRITRFPSANEVLTWPPMKVVVENHLPKTSPESFYLIDMVPGKVLDNLKFGLQEMVQGRINAATLMSEAQKAMDEVLAQRK